MSEKHATAADVAERRRASKSTQGSFSNCDGILVQGHDNRVRIVPLAHDPLEVEGGFRKSRKSAATMQRARGDEEDVERTSGTYLEGEVAVRRSLEESFFTFLRSSSKRAGCSAARAREGAASCRFDAG